MRFFVNNPADLLITYSRFQTSLLVALGFPQLWSTISCAFSLPSQLFSVKVSFSTLWCCESFLVALQCFSECFACMLCPPKLVAGLIGVGYLCTDLGLCAVATSLTLYDPNSVEHDAEWLALSDCDRKVLGLRRGGRYWTHHLKKCKLSVTNNSS